MKIKIKPEWVRTNVGWEKKKIIWLRVMKGDTPEEILNFISLNQETAEIYKGMPVTRATIDKVIRELEAVPLYIALRLIDEVPEMRFYFFRHRPDLEIDPNNIPPVKRLVKEKPKDGKQKKDNNHKKANSA